MENLTILKTGVWRTHSNIINAVDELLSGTSAISHPSASSSIIIDLDEVDVLLADHLDDPNNINYQARLEDILSKDPNIDIKFLFSQDLSLLELY